MDSDGQVDDIDFLGSGELMRHILFAEKDGIEERAAPEDLAHARTVRRREHSRDGIEE